MARDPSGRGPDSDPAALIERDHEAIVSAIDLVARGSAPRVTLANLRFGEALRERLAPRAAAVGVRLRPIWPADADSPIDLVVERDVDD